MTESKFKRLTAGECAKRLLQIKKPLVLIHLRPDGDAVSSGAALSLVFRQLGCECGILSPSKIPDRLNFILEKTGVCEGKYTEDCEPVSIDVASPAQLGTNISPVLMIDHHAVGEAFADGYTVPEASSAAEALLDVIDELISLGKVKMTEELAYALYCAISSDTGCFAYSNARAKTHRAAARLIETGIDAADINLRLFYSKTPEQIKAEGFISEKTRVANCGKISYSAVSLSDMESLGLTAEDFEGAIDVVRSVKGALVAFTVKEIERNKYRVSLRSTGPDVAKVAYALGGGGHIRAAGCTVCKDSIDEAIKTVLENLDII